MNELVVYSFFSQSYTGIPTTRNLRNHYNFWYGVLKKKKPLFSDYLVETYVEPVQTSSVALVSKLQGFSMKLLENGESTAVYPQWASRLGLIARWWLMLLYVWVRV